MFIFCNSVYEIVCVLNEKCYKAGEMKIKRHCLYTCDCFYKACLVWFKFVYKSYNTDLEAELKREKLL